jgi:hypothetical protein
MLSVVIGATPIQRVPAKVTERSVRVRASIGVKIIHSFDKDLPRPPGATGFSFVRFAAPELAERAGRVLYLDSDMIVYGDVAELLAIPFGDHHLLTPRTQAAVILMDAPRVPFSLQSVVEEHRRGTPGIMQLRGGLNGAVVGKILPDSWNSLDRCPDGTKNLHFTNMRNQPWLPSRPLRHPLADLWFAELLATVEEEHVSREEIEQDVAAGHLHRECLEVIR